jgi:hypothetical protein
VYAQPSSSFDEFCEQTSANGVVYANAAAGVAADLADKVLGDMGGLIMARLITPPTVRSGHLGRGTNSGSQQTNHCQSSACPHQASSCDLGTLAVRFVFEKNGNVV